MSSVREGAVYEVGHDGSARKLVEDERLISTLGIAVDATTGRLLVTNADIGAGIRRSSRGVRKEAGVGIYELASGKALQYVDLSHLVPDGEHLVNGIALDDQGNAYVTDSFSPAIYKIDRSGHASVFLFDEEFRGDGINLNGITYHPEGFLLVVKKSTGALYRIPRGDPNAFTRVRTAPELTGGDGLTLLGRQNLIVIANKTPATSANAAFVLRTEDGWDSAATIDTVSLGEIYPTTCAASGGRVYVLSSHLDEWLGAASEARGAIARRGRRAELRELGVVDDERLVPLATLGNSSRR